MTQKETGSHYSMVIQWDPEDRTYVVTVPELPGCQTHGETYEAAARRAQEAIESRIEAAVADGEPIPSPGVLAA